MRRSQGARPLPSISFGFGTALIPALSVLPVLALASGCPRLAVEVQPNAVPVALGTAETIAVDAGAEVVLDGSGSLDDDGDPLTYRWSQVPGGAVPVGIKNADQAVASFSAPAFNGVLFFQLEVSDGIDVSVPFVVEVTVTVPENARPQARATADVLSVQAGATVVLDGTPSTDAEGDALTFSWTQVTTVGEPVNLEDADSAVARFTAPDVPVRLFFQLVVDDGSQASVPFVVRVDVELAPNNQPRAAAVSESVTAVTGETVVLDGSASSDADGDTLIFRWSQVESGALPVNLTNADTAAASFTAPSTPATLFFQLEVNDGREDSVPFIVRVDVVLPPNERPVAVGTAESITVFTNEPVVLDGTDSIDGDGNDLTYAWSQVEGELVNLLGAEEAVASFTAPPLAGSLFFRLIVSDGVEDSIPFLVRVDVLERPNLPPVVALASAALTVDINDTVVMDASGSADPENRPLSFRWEQVENGSVPVNVNGAVTAVASFVAPDAAARLFFRLIVSDGVVEAPPAVVQVDVVAPPPNQVPTAVAAPIAAQVRSGASVNLTGSASFDPDGTIVAFRWSLLAGPPGGIAAFTPPAGDIADPQVEVIGRGSYFLGLVVTDDQGAESLASTVRIDALNNLPSASAGVNTSTVNGSPVTVIGNGLDLDGDALSFVWTLEEFPPGGAVSLVNANSSAVTFTPTTKTAETDPASCDQPNECYKLKLVVSDGREQSPPSFVFVTATNRAPIADAGLDDNVTSIIVLDAALSSDPDGDVVVDHTWTQVAGPALPGGPVFAGEHVEIVAPVADTYQFELVVNDGALDSAPDTVTVLVGDVNEPPVISCSTTRFVAPEGGNGNLSCTVTDLNLDVVGTTWTRTSGSSLFPLTLSGATPVLEGPSFAALLAAPEGNRAVYEITATDGIDAAVPVSVEVFGVPGAGVVVVDPGPASATTADCGTVLKPCATLAAAVAVVDPDGDDLGDGRDLVLTSNVFSLTQVTIPGGTSLLGGHDPTTFEINGDTELLHDGAAMSNAAFVRFPASAQDAVVERVTLRFSRASDSTRRALVCSGCTLTIRDSTIIANGAINLASLEVTAASSVVLERSRVEVSGARDDQFGVLVSGGDFIVRDSDVVLTLANRFGSNQAIRLSTGTALVERCRILVNGTFAENVTNGIEVGGGAMTATNNFIFIGTPGLPSAVRQTSGTGSYLSNTMVSPGGLGATGAIELDTPAQVMGNILEGFDRGVRMFNTGARRSAIYGNAFSSVSAELECVGLTPVLSDDVNAAASTADTATCNTSPSAWTGNIRASCPMVAPSSGDLHLNAGIPNSCIGAGVTSSPAGVAPTDDVDGVARTAPFDIGADQT